MTRGPHRGWVIVLVAILAASAGFAADPKSRSTSRSGQFIVYCDDRQTRAAVSSAAEETKAECLRLLHERDDWKFPIVLSLETGNPQERQTTPTLVRLVNTVAGPKIDVIAQIGGDPGADPIERHIVRALLLEMAYRDLPPVKGGDPIVSAPWWLAEGLFQIIRKRTGREDPDVFKSILNSEKLPSLEKFMAAQPVRIDSAAGAVDRACSLSLVDALVHLPNGPQDLGRFVRALPKRDGAGIAAVAKHFPVLGQSPESLAKWWTLQIAEQGRPSEWRLLSPAVSDKEIGTLEELEIGVDQTGLKKRFALIDFESFLKLPGAKPALQKAQVGMIALATRCDPRFRPILAEYEEICRMIIAGKTKGIAERLLEVMRRREEILQHAEKITDYLNWYEATQAPGSSGEFNSFLRYVELHTVTPAPLSAPDPRIAKYLDSLSRDFTPLRQSETPPSEEQKRAQR